MKAKIVFTVQTVSKPWLMTLAWQIEILRVSSRNSKIRLSERNRIACSVRLLVLKRLDGEIGYGKFGRRRCFKLFQDAIFNLRLQLC